MPQFSYRARDAQGGLVEGVLDCADRAVAIRQIESQHCVPIRIEMVDGAKATEKKPGAPAPRKKLRLLSSPEPATPGQSWAVAQFARQRVVRGRLKSRFQLWKSAGIDESGKQETRKRHR